MSDEIRMRQDPFLDFQSINLLLKLHRPFTFIRFSDGEMEIIHNSKLVIEEGSVEWRGGRNPASYPVFDNKTFLPDRDQDFRAALIQAAAFSANHYFKGIRTQGELGARDKSRMIELNGYKTDGLTFSDLLINQNWRSFLSTTLPLILNHKDVTFLGNFRARPKLLKASFGHIEIGDDVIPRFQGVMSRVMPNLETLPFASIVVSSASSLTNLAGHALFQIRPDITFIDVGTALNPFIGLEEGRREYHSQILPWSLKNTKTKALYYLLGSHKMRW